MPWEITSITDRRPGQHYRYRVEGWNTEGEIPREFTWSVPSVGDARYVPHASATDEVRSAIAAAKEGRAWGAPAPVFPPLGVTEADVDRAFGVRPCLACAREEQAAAGFGGIDRVQSGHSCGAPPAIYDLNDEPLGDLEEFIRTNLDPDAPALSLDQVEEIRHMMPGDTLHLGGGAGETFTLTRRR